MTASASASAIVPSSFGAFDLQGQRVLFKIDYYDMALECGSEDPADASITRRVLTVMLADDY